MKKCYKCHQEKELSEFYKTKANKDGLDGKCKQCRDEYYRAYSEKNRERISKRQAIWWKRKHETAIR